MRVTIALAVVANGALALVFFFDALAPKVQLPPSPSAPPPLPPPSPPQPPLAPLVPPLEIPAALVYVAIGVASILLLGLGCTRLPTRAKPTPATLPELPSKDQPSDVYEWTSSGGLVVRVRVPRRDGKPKGDWHILDQRDAAAGARGAPPPAGGKDAYSA